MTLNDITDNTDLNALLTEKERLTQIKISILALEQEVAKKLEVVTELHNAYHDALAVSTTAQKKADKAQLKAQKLQAKADRLKEKALDLHCPHQDKLNEVVTTQEALQAEKDKLEKLKAEIKAEKENQPIVTIDEIEERLETKKGGHDIRKENHLETAREIKLWMIDEPLNAAIVLSILQNISLNSDFFRSQDTDGTTVRDKYSHLVRLIDTAGHRKIKTIRDRLVFILRTKDSEY